MFVTYRKWVTLCYYCGDDFTWDNLYRHCHEVHEKHQCRRLVKGQRPKQPKYLNWRQKCGEPWERGLALRHLDDADSPTKSDWECN